MIQRGERLGFPLEACQAVGVVRERFGEHLDRDVAIQLRVAGTIDLSHAAFTDRRGHVVDAETSAGREDQTLWIIRAAAIVEEGKYVCLTEAPDCPSFLAA